MNEGGDDDCLIWENNQGWPFFNSNDLVGNGEKFMGDKFPDPIRSDTTKAIGEANTVNRKRSASDLKKDGNGSGEAKSGGRGGEGESDHEIHIWTERERRKKMRNMFSNIHVLLPQLPPKADKSTIVDEAVNYIKTLEKTLQKLQKKKLERLHPIGSTMNSYDPISIITSPSQKLLSVGCSREQFLADQGSTSNSAAITPTNYNKTASPLLNNVPATFQTWSSPHVILNVCGEEAHISVCCPKKVGLFSATCHVLEKHKIDIVSAQISSDHYRSTFMIQAHASGGSSLGQFSEPFTVEEIYQQAAAEIMLWTTSK
ncbi:hypothetical protein K7X08_036897 [Anisodus acutangulus]|uniref:BHLH domain-containing protein n=1 Tax=Anisodus acutangulus TaxID=402998 RepID=A0A9Q1L980_9SOLA|nr:hypothetical protein K7X08_036897 [Anisodus acutangulus]